MPHAASSEQAYAAAKRARAARRSRLKKQLGGNSELWSNVFGCAGIIFGILFIVAAIAFWYGTHLLLGVLNEIAEKEYTNQYQRISKYEVFFEGLTDAGYDVIREEPKLDTKPESSAKFYLWRVQPAGSSEFCIYRWRYDLQSDEVKPSTNAALLLDIEMGYIKHDDARNYEFYDPNDELAAAIAQDNLGIMQFQALSTVWESDKLPEGPVLPPPISIEDAEARQRAAVGVPEDEEGLAEGEAGGETGEATEVGGEPGNEDGGAGDGEAGEGGEGGAGDGGGDSTEVGGGGSGAGSGGGEGGGGDPGEPGDPGEGEGEGEEG